jgi:hypothetical protein
MPRKIKRKRITPLPEAVNGDSWRVSDGPPCVDLPTRHMLVPTNPGAAEEFMRAHEMAHVKITPPDPVEALAVREGISPDALNIVEDLRVHTFMLSRGIPAPAINTPDKRLDYIVKHEKNHRKLAGILVACAETGEYYEFQKAIQSLLSREESARLLRWVKIVLDNFRNFRDEYEDDPVARVSGFSQLTGPIARLFDSIFPPDGSAGDRRDGIPAEEYFSCLPSGEYVQWGELLPTRVAKMSLSKRARGSSRTWADEGVIPAAPYRLLIDSRIFSRKRKMKGGTVLIDASGSMGFSLDDLAAVIKEAPGATIAAYAGKSSSDWGHLVIAAKDGRMASVGDIHTALNFCEGNVVDGPALRWLAKQPGPRIWVSDGFVTGVEDRPAANLFVDANSIIAGAGIERVENWREVLIALK